MFIKPGKLYVMGILNVTPDSFSDKGAHLSKEKALRRAEEMINQGAHIIDIGGESTRPFSDPVGQEEELSRVIPVIEAIAERFDTLISVDTYKSEVAQEALKKGAHFINDISGFTFDENMINVAARFKCPCIAMHIKGTPKNMQIDPHYDNVVEEVYHFLKDRVEKLREKGVEEIIVDPGFGFGKSLDDNYVLLHNLERFKELDVPILAGISRKSMIGKLVDQPPEKRVAGTLALDTIAVLKGASILRVHDVAEHVQACKVLEKYQSTGDG